jgi:hypothetical protein
LNSFDINKKAYVDIFLPYDLHAKVVSLGCLASPVELVFLQKNWMVRTPKGNVPTEGIGVHLAKIQALEEDTSPLDSGEYHMRTLYHRYPDIVVSSF